MSRKSLSQSKNLNDTHDLMTLMTHVKVHSGVHSGTDPTVHFFRLFLGRKQIISYLCRENRKLICLENNVRRAEQVSTT